MPTEVVKPGTASLLNWTPRQQRYAKVCLAYADSFSDEERSCNTNRFGGGVTIEYGDWSKDGYYGGNREYVTTLPKTIFISTANGRELVGVFTKADETKSEGLSGSPTMNRTTIAPAMFKNGLNFVLGSYSFRNEKGEEELNIDVSSRDFFLPDLQRFLKYDSYMTQEQLHLVDNNGNTIFKWKPSISFSTKDKAPFVPPNKTLVKAGCCCCGLQFKDYNHPEKQFVHWGISRTPVEDMFAPNELLTMRVAKPETEAPFMPRKVETCRWDMWCRSVWSSDFHSLYCSYCSGTDTFYMLYAIFFCKLCRTTRPKTGAYKELSDGILQYRWQIFGPNTPEVLKSR